MNRISSGFYPIILALLMIISVTADQASAQQQRPPRPSGPPPAGQPGSFPPIGLKDLEQEINTTDEAEEKLEFITRFIFRTDVIHPDSVLTLISFFDQINGLDTELKEGYINFLKGLRFSRIQPDSSYAYAMKANSVLKDLDDPQLYLMNTKSITQYLIQRGKLIEAQTLYLEAINALEHEYDIPNKQEQLINLYQGLANLYTRARATDLALNIFDKLLQEDLPIGRKCGLLLSKSNALSMGERLQEAYDVIIPCLDVNELPTQMKVVINTSLGRISGRLEKPEQSIHYYEQALSYFNTESIPFQIMNDRRVFLAEAYLDNDMFGKADSLKRVVETEQERLRPDIEIYKNIVFARIELEQKNYTGSIEYADQAIQLADRMNMIMNLQDVHIIKSEALEALGKYSEALDVVREYNNINTMREKAIKEREMAAVNVQYQLTVRENELLSATETIESLSTKMKLLILSFIVLSIAGVVLYYRNRIKFLVKEEQTRNKIARDLHDDLSGTLSSISFFSEAAIRTVGKDEQSSQYLNMIDKSAVEAKEKINDIIWAINPENDDWESFITKCKRFAAESFESRDIRYELDMEDISGIKTSLELRQNLWLIIKETITNLIRHSEASSARLLLTTEGNELIYSISDDGKGVSQQESDSGNGLKNIRYRVSKLGGYSVLDSGSDGTEWVIRIPV